MAELRTGAKSKLHIGTKAADHLTDTYEQVTKVESLGEFGDDTQIIEFTPLETGEVDKASGSTNYGALNITLGFLPENPGQERIEDASADKGKWNFKITLNDAPTDDDGVVIGTPTIWYLPGSIVRSLKVNVPGANDIVKTTVVLELTKKPVRVPAAVTAS